MGQSSRRLSVVAAEEKGVLLRAGGPVRYTPTWRRKGSGEMAVATTRVRTRLVNLAMWSVLSFVVALLPPVPATTQSETPVAVEGSGVDDAALAGYRQAVADTLQYFTDTHGVSLTQPAVVRVYGTTEQYAQGLLKYFPGQAEAQRSAQQGSSYTADKDREILIDHSRNAQAFQHYPAVARSVTNLLQAELAGDGNKWKSCWLTGGHAGLVSWRVGDGGPTSYARSRVSALWNVRRAPSFSLIEAPYTCGSMNALRDRVGAPAMFGMNALAADSLAARQGFPAIVAYFRSLATLPAQDAFQSAFGLSMTDFVLDFDARLSEEIRTFFTVPLPEDLWINPPPPEVPQNMAAFSGKWSGSWDGMLDHILVVENITPPTASVIYANGAAPPWGIYQPSWGRVPGDFIGGALKLTLRNATAIYRMQSDDRLDAIYQVGNTTARATLTRLAE